MNYDKIGEFIALKRKEKNLTQRDLAKRIGVTDKAVSRWERGIGCPDVSILEILSKELDVSVLELLKGRKIENEVIKVTEADDYVKDTFKVSTKMNKEKNLKTYNMIIHIILICICAFLAFTNIKHFLTVSEKETFGPRKDIIEELDRLEKNVARIDELKSKLNEEDYQEISEHIKNVYEYYKNNKLIRLKGEYSLSEFWIIVDSSLFPNPGLVSIPEYVRTRMDKYTDMRILYDAFASSVMNRMTAISYIDNYYTNYFFKPLDASYFISENNLYLDRSVLYLYIELMWSHKTRLAAENALFEKILESGEMYE